MSIYAEAARQLNCSLAAIKAVASVESAGSGLLPSGKVKILFEAHIFSRLTGHKYDASNPDISSKKWNKKLYVGGEAEHLRLEGAKLLDRDAALQSASYGRFQIMGFNYKRCGFSSLDEFFKAMSTESGEMQAFVNFIKSMQLADELQRRDWAGFASVYNGPAYAKNKYDSKMQTAYVKFSKQVGL